jgi:hypothetical protein
MLVLPPNGPDRVLRRGCGPLRPRFSDDTNASFGLEVEWNLQAVWMAALRPILLKNSRLQSL